MPAVGIGPYYWSDAYACVLSIGISGPITSPTVNTFSTSLVSICDGDLTPSQLQLSTQGQSLGGFIWNNGTQISELPACRVATTADLGAIYNNGASGVLATLTLPLGAIIIDGLQLNNGDRVLVKNQAVAAQNGIYVVVDSGANSNSPVLVRAFDFDLPAQITQGSYVLVASGNTYTGNVFQQTTPGPTTVGTTGITWQVLAGQKAGYGRLTGKTAATSVATYVVGPNDGTFVVSANVRVTTATTHAFTATCTYTDEGGTSRTLTLSFTLVAGGSFVTSVANANGTVPYMGIPQHIRAKAGTSITIATTGTFTSVVYNVEGLIKLEA